jgi:hypothetical protein
MKAYWWAIWNIYEDLNIRIRQFQPPLKDIGVRFQGSSCPQSSERRIPAAFSNAQVRYFTGFQLFVFAVFIMVDLIKYPKPNGSQGPMPIRH